MRRRSRECALQILYQLDLTSEPDLESAISAYWDSFDKDIPVDREFAERLVRGVVARLTDVDAVISKVSAHWKVGRMAKVDRNLIRLASYEILHCPDIPAAASINEAIELAKRFSGDGAASFVNGVLDQIGKHADGEEPAE